MICLLSFLFAGLVAVYSQVLPIDPRLRPSEWNMDPGKSINGPYIVNNPISNPDIPKNNQSPIDPQAPTVIENKNLNVVVNVDPKDVAKELYKLIEVRSDKTQTRRMDNTMMTIGEIEKIIRPLVVTSRRSNRPTAFEVAYALDHVTRQSLYGDRRRPTIEDEIATREVVAKMMYKLKTITDKERAANNQFSSGLRPIARRMFAEDRINNDDNDNNGDDDNDDEQYINVNLKIRKNDLLRRGKTVTYVDF